MANMYCKNQKASSKEFLDNFDRTFRIHYKNCYAKILVKKEDLSEAARKQLYPEEADP